MELDLEFEIRKVIGIANYSKKRQFRNTVNDTDLLEVESAIERHNATFVVLYRKVQLDGQTITPKLHSLLHITRQIRLFGAPRNFWCYRYESKNAPFKKVMRRNCNFRNVPYTMATHHQKLVGLNYRSCGNSDYFEMAMVAVSDYSKLSNPKSKNCYPLWAHLLRASNDTLPISITQADKMFALSIDTIKISGRLCWKNSVFLKTSSTLEQLPEFWKIVDILLFDNGIVTLIMEHLETLCYANDYFSFIVHSHSPSKKSVLQVNSLNNRTSFLKFPVPLQCFNVKNQHHIVPNYYHMM